MNVQYIPQNELCWQNTERKVSEARRIRMPASAAMTFDRKGVAARSRATGKRSFYILHFTPFQNKMKK